MAAENYCVLPDCRGHCEPYMGLGLDTTAATGDERQPNVVSYMTYLVYVCRFTIVAALAS